MKYYLAYGSNLDRAQMRFRCPTAVEVGTTNLEGWRLAFKGSKTGSYLTIEPFAEGYVPLAIWAIKPADEAALDRYEGFPIFYYKKKFRVILNGQPVTAFAYIMDEAREYGEPSGVYMQTCLRGYGLHSFNEQLLYDAYDYSVERSGHYGIAAYRMS